MEFLSF